MAQRPVKVDTHKVRRFDDLPPAQQAGMLSNDSRFRTFAAVRMGLAPVTSATISASAAAEFIRRQCGVTSRRHLNANPDARDRFDRLRTEFDAWAGRISKPR